MGVCGWGVVVRVSVVCGCRWLRRRRLMTDRGRLSGSRRVCLCMDGRQGLVWGRGIGTSDVQQQQLQEEKEERTGCSIPWTTPRDSHTAACDASTAGWSASRRRTAASSHRTPAQQMAGHGHNWRADTSTALHVQTCCAALRCSLVEGVLSHEMNRFIIDANKAVLNRPTADQKACCFREGLKFLVRGRKLLAERGKSFPRWGLL